MFRHRNELDNIIFDFTFRAQRIKNQMKTKDQKIKDQKINNL